VKAVIIHATGDADVLRHGEVERRQSGEDEVLITVQADGAVGHGLAAEPRSASLGI
jgi:NADPH:quinone reductase-like Zn-dependent oxidoreductase